MKTLYKMEEWQDTCTGYWHCNDTSHGIKSAAWWVVPQLLGITYSAYAKMLVEEYHAELLYYKERGLLLFKWRKQTDMRRYKNMVNRVAREKQFYIED